MVRIKNKIILREEETQYAEAKVSLTKLTI